MTPSQRQLIKEAFSEGYEQALNEQGPRTVADRLRLALLRRAEQARRVGNIDTFNRIRRGLPYNPPVRADLDRIYRYIMIRMRAADIMAPGMSKRLVQNLDNLYQQLMRQVEAGTMTISEAIDRDWET